MAKAVPFEQQTGPDGVVSIEAEDFDDNVAQGDHAWVLVTSPAGFSGTGAMQALPNTGVNNNVGYVTASPRLDFKVNFVKTGMHYVWVRGHALASGENDSWHAGLDGQAVDTADRGALDAASDWQWHNNDMDGGKVTLNIDAAGVHTVNIWMREDGAIIDKIVLTTNPDYVPTDDGPAESSRGPRGNASDASPADGATDVVRDARPWPGRRDSLQLRTTCTSAPSSTTSTPPAGPIRRACWSARARTPTTYDPAGLLDFGQTYYWRVDEVNAPPTDSTLFKGSVWSFTAETYGYPVKPIKATASSSQQRPDGP